MNFLSKSIRFPAEMVGYGQAIKVMEIVGKEFHKIGSSCSWCLPHSTASRYQKFHLRNNVHLLHDE